MFKKNDHAQKIKAVIFDMDGVITNTMPYHYRCWRDIFIKNGINATRLDVYLREGQKGIESVFEIFKEHGKTISFLKAHQILKEKEIHFKKTVQQRFILGARSFLKELASKGFQIALVTGTSRQELHKILPKNIYKLFAAIITGTDVKNGKPHPEPYLKCLKSLKIKAQEAIVIENAPFGVKSAKMAGLKCLALETSLPKKYLKDADRIFKSIKELRKEIIFR
jgi:beta-phosphoglucomutase